MRFLVFSDVHLHLWKLGDPLKRLKDQIRLLRQMKEYAVANNISDILFSGDLFHTHGSLRSEVIFEAHELFNEIAFEGISVIGISGNHDLADREGKYTSIQSIHISLIKDIESPWELENSQVPVCGITYTEDKLKLQEQLNYLPRSPHILLLHQGVSGVEINSKGFTLNEILTPDMIPDSTLIAFSGHYHSHKQLGKLVIPGALCQHHFADVGDSRGFLDVEFVNGKFEIKQIKSPEFFHTLEYSNTDNLINSLKNFKDDWQRFFKVQKVPSNKSLEIKEALLDEKLFHNIQLIFNEQEIKRISSVEESPTIKNILEKFISTHTASISTRRKEIGQQIIEDTYKYEL